MNLQPALLALLAIHTFALNAAELSREATYKSLEEFVATAQSFRPATSKGEFQKLFSIPELGEMTPGDVRPDRIAKSMTACETVSSGDQWAQVLARARPPTEATPSEIGLLIYLERATNGWMIKDVCRFTATGKYAMIKAETASSGQNGNVGFLPLVTIKEFQGGRGYSYELSATHTIEAHKIVRRELN